MKTFLTLILVTVTTLMVNAQSQLHTILVGDTVELRVTGHHGNVQWQQSTDSLTWTNMAGFLMLFLNILSSLKKPSNSSWSKPIANL